MPEVQEYYYHSFSVMQPDLNWKNPSLRKELYRMIQFWMDKGIRGFRLDAVDSHQFKLKNHTELLAFRIRILLCHFYRSTSGFPHCQDLF